MHNITMQTPAHDVVHITYEDLGSIEYQPPRQTDSVERTVHFRLESNDTDGILLSSALEGGCNALIGATNPAPWDERVSAKFSLRLHVSRSAPRLLFNILTIYLRSMDINLTVDSSWPADPLPNASLSLLRHLLVNSLKTW